MLWLGVDQLARRHLRKRPQVHHRHAVADVLHHAHVVGDEQVGQAQVALQLLQEVEDLCLDRDVQRAHRLVADEQVRLEHECPRDPDPLALPAGELVRIAPRVVVLQTDQLHHSRHALAPLRDSADAVDPKPLADRGPDGRARIERGEWILEDDLHPAPERLERRSPQRADLLAIKGDRPAGGIEEAQQEPADRRLAAARLADEAQRLAAPNREAHVVDRLHIAAPALEDSAGDREVLGQVLDLDQRPVVALRGPHRVVPSDSWYIQQRTSCPPRASRSSG